MPETMKHLGVMAFIWVHFWVLLTILLALMSFVTGSNREGVSSDLLYSMIWITGFAMIGSLIVTWRVGRRFRTWVLTPGSDREKRAAVAVCIFLAVVSAGKMFLR